MATVNKDFRVKNGLIVEGTTATVDGSNVLTEASTVFLNNIIKDQAGDLLENAVLTNIVVSYDDVTNALTITAENGVADSTTDDLVEGSTNLYFTSERAQDAIAQMIDSGSHSNIIITYDDANNTISFTAENGVADSTTDDLVEGSNNLYYTDARARNAVSGGNGITYNSTNGQIQIDDAVVATDTDVSTAITNHNQTATGVHGVTGAVVGTTDQQTISNKTLGSNLDANGFTVTNLKTPTNASDAATKGYVDTAAEGLSVKPAVQAATTGPLTAVYDNGTNGINATLNLGPSATLDIDGITTWDIEDGVLVKDQTNAYENGRYYVVQIGDASTDWILQRCFACDEPDEIPSAYVFVQGGNTYASTGWFAQVSDPGAFDVGVDDINWIQFSGAGTYTAGNGLTLTGTEFSIDTATTVDIDSVQTLTNKSIDASDNTLTNVANASLVNDSITVNGYSTALGSSVTLDTDDVGEGSANLYFTDQRAIDALEAVTPNFTEVDINSVAKQVAATVSLADTTQTAAYSFAKADYRSAKFVVKFAFGVHTEVSEVLVTLDTSDNIAITEYAVVSTNGNLGDISAGINGTNIELLVTAVNSSTDVTVFGTLVA